MVETILNRLRRKLSLKSSRARISVFLSLFIIFSILIHFAYSEYKRTVIIQQQQNMLGTSRAISRSIDLFINESIDSIKIITLDKDFIKEVSNFEQGKLEDVNMENLKSYYEAKGDTVNAIYFIDDKGKLITQYPTGTGRVNSIIDADIKTAMERKKTYIGRVYFDKSVNSFLLNIYEPIFDNEEFKGVLAAAIRLDGIYNKFVGPVKVGEKGYAMVKDHTGIIIMHPVKEQVGMDVIESRKEVYPNLDYKELEKLIEDQLKGNEGTAVYHSYWWGDRDLKKIRKLSAYSPVKMGDHFWVVALTMSYDEIQGPINRFLMIVSAIGALTAIMIYIFASALIKVRRDREELEKETKYLKMLNEASEQLRKKEAELNHSHKLKMIGTLTGGIAHDINNLLTPILGYSEFLLMRMPQDSEYYEEVDEILKASQKGKEMIEQLLQFSRNDNGTAKLERIDIAKSVQETLKLFKTVLPKNIIVRENIDENSGYVNANHTQLHQVVYNLCSNAYQSIKSKSGMIEISLKCMDGASANGINSLLSKENNYAELVIRDNGCGMDEETKNRIFEPFFTTKDIGKGTGLGLFVVQSIVDSHGGAVTVESEKGIGSCFRVFLPLKIDEIFAESTPAAMDVLQGSGRILLVDDSSEVLEVLKKGLAHFGYEVVTETDPLYALEHFKSDHDDFDLVITDYMMPGIKGDAFAAAVKDIKKAVGVILMTGYMDKDENIICKSDYIDAFIKKPIELNNLLEILTSFQINAPKET